MEEQLLTELVAVPSLAIVRIIKDLQLFVRRLRECKELLYQHQKTLGNLNVKKRVKTSQMKKLRSRFVQPVAHAYTNYNFQDVCKKVRALMNKITPTSQIPLTKEFISYNVSSNDEQLGQVVGIVFDKAVEEPKFCALYAELCRSQAEHEMKLTARKSAFRNKVLTITQNTFQDRKEVNEERMAAIDKEEDPAKRELMRLEERQKFRRRKFGVMIFIGHLYRNQLLSTKIVQTCTFELLGSIVPKKIDGKGEELKKENVDEESVHCALQLIETVGSTLDKSPDCTPQFLDQWFSKLELAKPYCSNKIRFMIMNLIELRNNKWIQRKSVESGPKKIDEIHNDIRQEKIENEKARDQYDRDRDRRHGGGVRQNSNSLRKQGPVSRNSLERNKGYQHPEQKRAAAAATTKLTSTSKCSFIIRKLYQYFRCTTKEHLLVRVERFSAWKK